MGGAVLAGAAAGGAYYKRDDLTQGFTWATDHLRYAGNLWDEAALAKRVEDLIDIENEHGVIFRTFVSIVFVPHQNSETHLYGFIDCTPFCHPNHPNTLPLAPSLCFPNTKVVRKPILFQQPMVSLQTRLRATQGCSLNRRTMDMISLASRALT